MGWWTFARVPHDWDDDRWITFEDFCKLFELPQRTVRDWKRRGIGPTWTKAPGTGRLYIQIRQARGFPAAIDTKEGAGDGRTRA